MATEAAAADAHGGEGGHDEIAALRAIELEIEDLEQDLARRQEGVKGAKAKLEEKIMELRRRVRGQAEPELPFEGADRAARGPRKPNGGAGPATPAPEETVAGEPVIGEIVRVSPAPGSREEAEQLHAMLGKVMAEPLSVSALLALTQTERDDVYVWAVAKHVTDEGGVVDVPRTPKCLRHLGTGSGAAAAAPVEEPHRYPARGTRAGRKARGAGAETKAAGKKRGRRGKSRG